jgi:hypothetical protein
MIAVVDGFIRMNSRHFETIDLFSAGKLSNEPADKLGLTDISAGPGNNQQVRHCCDGHL